MVKAAFGAKISDKNSRYVSVCGWQNDRRIIARDGLISFQVTVHSTWCYYCGSRFCFVQQQLVDRNVQCFARVNRATPHCTSRLVRRLRAHPRKCIFHVSWDYLFRCTAAQLNGLANSEKRKLGHASAATFSINPKLADPSACS